MIAKMTKTSIVVITSLKEDALQKLRNAGILHLEEMTGKGEKLEDLTDNRDLLERAMFMLDQKKISTKKSSGLKAAIELAESVISKSEKIRGNYDKLDKISRELERIEPWGGFDPGDILELQAKKIPLKLFELRAKDKLPEEQR